MDKDKIEEDPKLRQLKDEITQLNFEVEKMWKVLLDMQKNMGALENIIRSASVNTLLQ